KQVTMSRRLFIVPLLAVWGAMIPACGNSGRYGSGNSPASARSSGQPAPTEFPTKAFVRESFRFDYPGSWTIDGKDEEYDPDSCISVDTSEDAFIKFRVFDPVNDPSKILAIMARGHEKNMPGCTKTEFKRWGRYDGLGISLQWTYKNIAKSTVRVF